MICGYNSKNKRVWICLLFGCLLWLLPAWLRAEEQVERIRLVVRPSPRTGKLVRTAYRMKSQPDLVAGRQAEMRTAGAQSKAATPGTGAPEAVVNISAIVEKAAQTYNVDPLLVHSVIAVESNYNPLAVSPKGANGLMQLIPATAKRLGVVDPFDPRQNIEAGVRYLRMLKDRFGDDRLALAAYNAGEGAVLRHGGIPPYRETKEYVEKVGRKYLRTLSGQTPKPSFELETGSPEPQAPEAVSSVRKLEAYIDAEGRVHLRTR